ncbi:MAG: hypothetical protein CSA11_11990 [Chloroflexi bacterium]|nr:MAG: hypothetical protein CSA11_11990 [Chloroflexota bacterium]
MGQIVVTFSESMVGDTLTRKNIILTGGPSGNGVTSNIETTAATATLTMSGAFPPSQTEAYILTIKKEVKDLAGNGMEQDHVVHFYVTEKTFELGTAGNTVPLQMVWVPAGSFQMGSADDDPDAWKNENPRHGVTFAQGFWLGKYEVTQKQWKAVMGSNSSYFQGGNIPAGMDADNLPVEKAGCSCPGKCHAKSAKEDSMLIRLLSFPLPPNSHPSHISTFERSKIQDI